MSKLKEKSELNLTAAEYLINKDLYAPSVHCSYYACFQLMKYTIKEFFGMEYDELTDNIAKNRLNTHGYIIKYVLDEIQSNWDRFEYSKFSRKIKDLKNFREESDYDNIEISIDQSNKAFQYAKDIRNFLKSNFHV